MALTRAATKSAGTRRVALSISGLEVDFGTSKALIDTSMEIREGELVCLLGPSGCGKTTTLNAIAGLIVPTSGNIFLRGRDVTLLEPRKRKLGMVFQSYALYPHMNVYRNIAFPLRNDRDFKNSIRYHNKDVDFEVLMKVAEMRGIPADKIKAHRTEIDAIHDRIIEQKDQISQLKNLDANARVRVKTARIHAQSEKISNLRSFSIGALDRMSPSNIYKTTSTKLLDGKQMDVKGEAVRGIRSLAFKKKMGEELSLRTERDTKYDAPDFLPKGFEYKGYTRVEMFKDIVAARATHKAEVAAAKSKSEQPVSPKDSHTGNVVRTRVVNFMGVNVPIRNRLESSIDLIKRLDLAQRKKTDAIMGAKVKLMMAKGRSFPAVNKAIAKYEIERDYRQLRRNLRERGSMEMSVALQRVAAVRKDIRHKLAEHAAHLRQERQRLAEVESSFADLVSAARSKPKAA